jgi:carbon-monoxide dehydrogenase large subunit
MDMIGQSPRRREDGRLLVGRGRFVDDLRPPGLLHMVLVRSPHARARILDVDTKSAEGVPGVVAVFVNEDLPALTNILPTFVEPASNPYAVFNTPPPQLALARGEVRHVGEAVAVVVADTVYAARDGADAVAVEYDPLPALVDAVAAMQDGADQVHAGLGNVVGQIRMHVGDVDAAMARADVVIEDRIDYARVTSMPMEPRAVCAQWDPTTETMTVWSGAQIPYMVRDAVALFLGLRNESVRVLVQDTGGGFGPKAAVYPEDVLAAVIAHRLGRPVKWVQTRTEFMLSSQHSREQYHWVKLGAMRDGRLVALDVRIVKDVGAYHSWALIDPTNCVNHMPSHYILPNIRAEGVCVLTNKVPTSPYRGAGRPEAVFVIDSLLDRLARELGMDAAEVRLKNVIPAEAMPYRPGTVYRDGVPCVYDGGDYPFELRKALELADYDGWRKRQAALRAEGRYIGVGISSYLEAGGVGWPCEGATVKVDDQGKVEVMIGVSQSGQGHETVFAQVAAQYLGASYDDVRVRGGDTALIAYGFGTGASRVAVNTGNAVLEAAEAVRVKAAKVAARLLECDEKDVRVEDSKAFVAGSPMKAVPFATLAKAALRDRNLAALGGPGLIETKYYYPPSVTWSSGVNVAVVEVDPETGAWRCLSYVAVHDCGTQLNPMIVDGQVLGGFAQGYGVALGESIHYDETGQMLTGSMMDYPIPRADEMPVFVTEHLHFPTTHNRLGVRGVGEGPTGPPPAALANAVADALGGRPRFRFPALTAPRVVDAMRDAGIEPARRPL